MFLQICNFKEECFTIISKTKIFVIKIIMFIIYLRFSYTRDYINVKFKDSKLIK